MQFRGGSRFLQSRKKIITIAVLLAIVFVYFWKWNYEALRFDRILTSQRQWRLVNFPEVDGHPCFNWAAAPQPTNELGFVAIIRCMEPPFHENKYLKVFESQSFLGKVSLDFEAGVATWESRQLLPGPSSHSLHTLGSFVNNNPLARVGGAPRMGIEDLMPFWATDGKLLAVGNFAATLEFSVMIVVEISDAQPISAFRTEWVPTLDNADRLPTDLVQVPQKNWSPIISVSSVQPGVQYFVTCWAPEIRTVRLDLMTREAVQIAATRAPALLNGARGGRSIWPFCEPSSEHCKEFLALVHFRRGTEYEPQYSYRWVLVEFGKSSQFSVRAVSLEFVFESTGTTYVKSFSLISGPSGSVKVLITGSIADTYNVLIDTNLNTIRDMLVGIPS